jgi:hypothetical protein
MGGQGAPPINIPFSATPTVEVSAGRDYFYLLLTGNVTTFSFSNVDVQNAEEVIVMFQQDGTGSRTVGFAANIFGATVSGTANKYTMCIFQYDTASNSWYCTSQSGAKSG